MSRTGLRQWWEQPEFIGDASVIMGLGVHAVDLMRFLLGQEVTEVSAITDGQTVEQPLEHLATMLLRFDGGTIASICCGRFLPDTQNDFTVYGTDGRITGIATLWEARMGRVQVASESVNQTEVYPYDYLANFIAELEDFHQAIEEDRRPAATGLDGLHVAQVTSAMVDSARTKRTIKLEPLLV